MSQFVGVVVEEENKVPTVTRKTVLFNISNHPSEKWSDEQKAEWDEIIDIPFPSISPRMSSGEVASLVMQVIDFVLDETLKRDDEVYIYVAGEYSFCYLFIMNCPIRKFAIPTSERIVEEKPDGTTVRKFKFVKWRRLVL